MQTAQEFFDDYLAEKTAMAEAFHQMSSPMHAKYFAAEYIKHREAWRADTEAERFDRAEVFGPTAKVYTVHRVGKSQMHHRYQLRLMEEKWEIHTHGSLCFACKGTGRHHENVCKYCQGEGWNELFKDRS